jgi:hypothetical protein
VSLADVWLALAEVAAHDVSTEERFARGYDPLAAAAEEARCDPRRGGNTTTLFVPGCGPRPMGFFVEWEGPERAGYVGYGDPYIPPMELATIEVTRVDDDTLRVRQVEPCGAWEEEVELHLLSATRAWAFVCGVRTEIMRGASMRARRERWEAAHVAAMLTSARKQLPSVTFAGLWRIDGMEQRCFFALDECRATAPAVACAPASEPSTGRYTEVVRLGDTWTLRAGRSLAECAYGGGGGLTD